MRPARERCSRRKEAERTKEVKVRHRRRRLPGRPAGQAGSQETEGEGRGNNARRGKVTVRRQNPARADVHPTAKRKRNLTYSKIIGKKRVLPLVKTYNTPING